MSDGGIPEIAVGWKEDFNAKNNDPYRTIDRKIANEAVGRRIKVKRLELENPHILENSRAKEQIKTSVLNPEEEKIILQECIRGMDDEALIPLTRGINKALDERGLNKAHKDLGIRRFIGISQQRRKDIAQGRSFVIQDGAFSLDYTTKMDEKRQEATLFGSGYAATHYKFRGNVKLGHDPITVGEQISSYMRLERADSLVRDKLRIRIHECAHRWNSGYQGIETENLRGTRGTLIADIFRESHSEMANQACNINYSDKNIIDTLSGNPEFYRNFSKDNVEAYFSHYGHKEMSLSQESKQMATYAVDVIWQLRALGYNEAEAGELIIDFQRKAMLDWNSDTQNCSKIETWLWKQWLGKKVVWKKTSLEHPNSVEQKVAKIKARFEQNNRDVQNIVIEQTTDFLAQQQKPIVLFDSFSNYPKKVDVILPDGIKLQPGEIILANYWLGLFGQPSVYKLEILNLKDKTKRELDTDGFESWFGVASERHSEAFVTLNF